VQEIDALCFYKKEGKTHVGAHGGGALYCEFCGDCLAVCPVGAIVSRFSKYAFKPWQLTQTETTCTYCSDGCTVRLESEGGRVVRVTSKLSYLSKFGQDVEPGDGHGGLCVRGRFGFQLIGSDQRLSKPLAKIDKGDDRQIEIPWFKAIPMAARRFSEIKAQYGGEAMAGLIGGRGTNEEVYLFGRLMRTVLGSPHIDTSARYGHMNSVLALQEIFGIGWSTTSYNKITLSDVLFMIGSDLTETNPVASLRVKEAKSKFKARLIVADSVDTHIRRLATHPLPVKIGGESALLCGMVKAVIAGGWVDPSFAAQYPDALVALTQHVASLSTEEMVAKSGVAWEKIVEAAQALAQSKRGTIIWGEGIVQRSGGYENVLRLIDLAMLTGTMTKPGGGIHPICEENNEQGAVDFGGTPEFLPGQRLPTFSQRAKLASAWNAALPEGRGWTLPEMIEQADAGKIKALWIVGENPLGTLPASMQVAAAFAKIDFIVCQDPFLTESGRAADLVLPAALFAEKEGTFTGMDGKPRPVARAFDPRGEARPDWKIFSDIAKQMGQPLSYRSPEEIRGEMEQVVPGYFAGVRPAPHERTRYMDADFVAEIGARYRPTDRVVTCDFPHTLRLYQSIYHSGKLSTRDDALMKISHRPTLKISPADAATIDVKTDDSVRVRSPLAEVEVIVEVMADLPAGLLQFPEHFNQPPLKDLLPVEIDPTTHVPYFKSGLVAIEKVPHDGLAILESNTGVAVASVSEPERPDANPTQV
jgi:formate dehydrogenase alpha subunit